MQVKKVRGLRKKEYKTLRNALSFYRSLYLLQEYEFVILEKERKEVYMVPKNVKKFLELYELKPKIAGIKVGEIGRRMRITLEGGEVLSKRYKGKRVIVNDKGEMLFLYGRDLFGSSIVKWTDDIEENDIVFVFSRAGYLGLGRARVDHKRMKEDRVVISNLVDKGEYLRKIRIFDAF